MGVAGWRSTIASRRRLPTGSALNTLRMRASVYGGSQLWSYGAMPALRLGGRRGCPLTPACESSRDEDAGGALVPEDGSGLATRMTPGGSLTGATRVGDWISHQVETMVAAASAAAPTDFDVQRARAITGGTPTSVGAVSDAVAARGRSRLAPCVRVSSSNERRLRSLVQHVGCAGLKPLGHFQRRGGRNRAP